MEALGFNLITPCSTNSKDKIEKEVKNDGQETTDEDAKERHPWNRLVLYQVSIMTAVVLALRLHSIDVPDVVSWDEAHFGKFASYYLNRTYFFDVHPPLGKLIHAGFGYIAGHQPDHPFESPGDSLGNHTRTVSRMRMGCASMGALVIPFGYITVLEKTGSTSAALLASALLTFDTGLSVLCRYILLDSILLCFIFGAAMGDAKFRNEKQCFSKSWWGWLIFTGLMLGSTLSTKYVGVFVFLYVGLSTVHQLWSILGDRNIKPVQFIAHFLARSFALILVPILVYVAAFYLHFLVLTAEGPGTTYYHPNFQALFHGNRYADAEIPKYVSYQAEISLRGSCVYTGYLHSHPVNYPKGEGSRQQMVTHYQHEDDNNMFLIKRWEDTIQSFNSSQLVRHGDLVRLEHINTGRNIHSHNVASSIVKNHYQVTGYGWKGKGDANDIWRVELKNGRQGDPVQTITSEITLRHYHLNCILSTTGHPLPRWGLGQDQVLCSKWDLSLDESLPMGCSRWRVIKNLINNPEIERIKINSLTPSFWEKFVLNHEMMFTKRNKYTLEEIQTKTEKNKSINLKSNDEKSELMILKKDEESELMILKKDEECESMILKKDEESEPIILKKDEEFEPIILKKDDESELKRRLEDECRIISGLGWMLLGWGLHYLPFFMMGRVLYQHHYYPASIFISLFSASLVELLVRNLSPILRNLILGSLLLILLLSFSLFSPIVYGIPGDKARFRNSSYHYLHWTDYWDF
ncbi:protein O-mannosyl-transferase 2 [Eurytemora carolleeae]|uniref:protein O-mannosyl-transferase 2 n=1 Tax=Eurytemora carolleeae TaxID=1294199 RepID=UPI000C76DB3E|nr:protein O-mannosyl-transferase 2 [Eurytemora carolleeae]|eukprot:XP_023342977.1 protein O-mannosyl-transferase 2-like [Eurytemora affinis]